MSKYRYELMLIISCFAYGISYPISKFVQGYITTFVFMGVRGVLGFATIAIFFLMGCRKEPARLAALKDKRLWKYAFICAILSGSGMYLSMYALNFTMASKATFVTCSYVLMMPVVSMIFFKGKTTSDQFVALMVATVGMAFVSGIISDAGFSFDSVNLGDIMSFVAAIIMAFSAVYLNHITQKISFEMSSFTAVQMFFTMFLYLGVWFVAAPNERIAFETPLVLGATLFVGIGVAGFAFLAYNLPLKMLPPARSAIILATEPIFSAVGAYFIRDRWGNNEVLTFLQMIGCAVILIAVVGGELYSLKKKGALSASNNN